MFEIQADEASVSPVKPEPNEWQWDSDDTEDTISAISKSLSKNMFQIPNLSSVNSNE